MKTDAKELNVQYFGIKGMLDRNNINKQLEKRMLLK